MKLYDYISIFAPAAMALILYLIIAFIYWSPDPGKWGIEIRKDVMAIELFGLVIYYACYLVWKNNTSWAAKKEYNEES